MEKSWIKDGLEETTYRAIKACSASTAKALISEGGPEKFAWNINHPTPSTDVLNFGSAAHQAVLGGGEQLVEIPADMLSKTGTAITKAAKEFKEQTALEGKRAMTPTEMAKLTDMANVVHSRFGGLLKDFRPEVSFGYVHPDSGVEVKGRIDALLPGGIVDYKTVASADLEMFRRNVIRYGYHIQAAHYFDSARALGLDIKFFYFLLQEKEAPYQARLVELDERYFELGRADFAKGMKIWKQCIETDQWPGLPTEVTKIEPLPWQVPKNENQESWTVDDLESALLKAGKIASRELNNARKQLEDLTRESALAGIVSARKWAKATGTSPSTAAKKFKEARQDEEF